MKTYTPTPIDTVLIEMSAHLMELTERLAEHAHDVWAQQRLSQGWSYGPSRCDQGKKHPCLVPYSDLPESEKEYDQQAAIQTLKAVIALGYRIEKIVGDNGAQGSTVDRDGV